MNGQVEKNEMYFLVVNFEAAVEDLEEEKADVVVIGDRSGLTFLWSYARHLPRVSCVYLPLSKCYV